MTRRTFATAALLAAAYPAFARFPRIGGKPLRILILGGTGFLGPHIAEAAQARGHSVTLFNRGRTEKRRGKVEGVESLYGNRDPNLRADDNDPDSPQGLTELQGKTWDAAIDTSGYVPRIVKASTELLAPSIQHYVFISTISVYADNSKPGSDESAPTGTMADPTVESMGTQMENYGPLKALCEQAAEAAMPGRVSNIRPGFIVGPGDPTDRFTYWPVRVARGGEVLAPGTPEDPVQFIDVRDLAAFCVLACETKAAGVFNACGPKDQFSTGSLLNACKDAAGSNATFTWIPYQFLAEQRVGIGSELPITLPPDGETAGFHRWSNAKAVAAGLTFRPAIDTCRDTLAWWPKEIERRTRVTKDIITEAETAGKPAPQMPAPSVIRMGLKPDREIQLLHAWNTRGG